MVAPERLRTRLLRLDDATLQSQWRDLQAGDAVSSPFLTWQWNKALGDIPSAAGNAYVLTAEEPSGRVLGLLPLEWSATTERLRRVGFAGWHWLSPDHLDVVAAPAHRSRVAQAITRHLAATHNWDVLDLDGLAPGGSLADAAQWLHLPLYYRMRPEPVTCPCVDLTRGADVATILPSRNLRQQVNRGVRANGGLSVITDPDQVVPALNRLMALHNARFGSSSAVFATPERRGFHALAAYRLAIDGLARIYQLGSTGEDAALLYALVWNERIHYYSMGINSAVRGSPGLSLLGAAIVSAAQEGFVEFDLLRGDHAFKLRFATMSRNDVRLRVVRPTPRVAAQLALRARSRLRAGLWSTR